MKNQGFTLVELLVSIGIFTAVTAVAVFNHTQFNSSVLLTDLAYEVALSIRQAQFYGITVKQTSADPTKFTSGYGIHFDTGSNKTYTLFEDVKNGGTPPNHVRAGADGDVDIETFKIEKGNTISKICLDGTTPCSNAVVDISFVRPNPDAYIRANGNTSTAYAKAEVCILSPANIKRKVVVESTGQISVVMDTTGICN
jgi:prepilin-type N-terminal cleavage/methylation domain-containing protein